MEVVDIIITLLKGEQHMNELQQFITNFQSHAMVHGSKHYVTGQHMTRGWHSDTIIQACIDKFGEEGYRNEGIVNDKQIAKDAKAFMVQQIKEK